MPKALMTLGALSVATGIPAPTLRTWTNRGWLQCANVTSAGTRLYTDSAKEKAVELRASRTRNGRRAD